MKEMVSKFYSERYDRNIEPGLIVVFDNSNIGMVTELYQENGTLWASIKQPSGRNRERVLKHDLDEGKIFPFDWREASYLNSKAWEEWKRENEGSK